MSVKSLFTAQTPELVQDATKDLMDGKLTQAQQAAFLTILKLRGLDHEPVYVHAVASQLARHAVPLPDTPCVDIVGTGGDGQDTFNVSTAASIIAAGAGLRVCKHGNRASSSNCGSADVLEALGLDLNNTGPSAVAAHDGRFAFLFAQLYHPCLRNVAQTRRELAVRTVFNLVGPLTNPAKPHRMVVGVYSPSVGPIMAQTLKLMGVGRAWVVHGAIGLDEISPEGVTSVWDLDGDNITQQTISPADFGLPSHALNEVRGGSAQDNAQIMLQLLDNDLDGPVLDFCLLNAAALLFVAGKANSLKDAVYLARESIESGSAKRELDHFIKTCSIDHTKEEE